MSTIYLKYYYDILVSTRLPTINEKRKGRGADKTRIWGNEYSILKKSRDCNEITTTCGGRETSRTRELG
jgi:hypothetical protein